MRDASGRKHVLIVDDEEFVRLLVAEILERNGYRVEMAADGAAALTLMEVRRPDLVLLDLMMPGLTGWAVLERMRQAGGMPPVVILTAHGSYEAFTRVVKEGVAGYISKPFALDELLVTCARALASAPLYEPDRRQDARRALVVRVRILSPDAASLAMGELVNLSLTGGQVELAVPLPAGEKVRLTVDVPGGGTPLALDAVVEWREPAEGRYRHGLVFTALDSATQRELQELLSPA
jgi:DNA-binding response OmpR family regulator